MINVKKVYKVFLFFFFSFIVVFHPTYAAEPKESIRLDKLHFKLGFEFQESSSLCPWAWPNNNIQKKALFEVNGPDQKRLWHVELDTVDIEFVTVPFSLHQKYSLELALESITTSLECLKGLLNSKNGKIAFSDWISVLSTSFKKGLELNIIEDWVLVKAIESKELPWNPIISPQATIQHPLEWSIPLYFGLMGFESFDMHMFYGSLPCRNLLLQASESLNREMVSTILESYTKKLNGLVFLHASTLIGMTPPGKPSTTDDEEALIKAVQDINTIYQIDPKPFIKLLSRRPFSSMLKDIKIYMTESYEDYFKKSIINNNKVFIDFFEVPSLFFATNYGEQFFNADGGFASFDYSTMSIDPEFFEKNKETIVQLFKQGVITTTIIRHCNDGLSIMNNFYQHAISIEKESYTRYNVTVNSESNTVDIVKKVDDMSDPVSPPWFLQPNCSMGRFKNDDEIDKDFGEAIIEIRGIKCIGNWCLDKLGLDRKEYKNKFLTRPDQFFTHGLMLFDFLTTFDAEKIKDVEFGILKYIDKY
ncbi:MAG: hypothetical protein ACOH2V_13270 [Candidatus Saccharimonadaceae bacterium]